MAYNYYFLLHWTLQHVIPLWYDDDLLHIEQHRDLLWRQTGGPWHDADFQRSCRHDIRLSGQQLYSDAKSLPLQHNLRLVEASARPVDVHLGLSGD